MGVFNTGLFSKPRYSAFPWAHSNRISMNAGVLMPIATEFLNQGDKIDSVDMSAVVRNAPMLAPTLDTYRVDMHAFAVRLRSIGHSMRDPWTYEDFFNLNKNSAGSNRLPSFPLGAAFAVNGLKTGTLFESLGLPTFKEDRENYLEYLRNRHPYLFDPVVKVLIDGTTVNSVTYAGAICPASCPYIGYGTGQGVGQDFFDVASYRSLPTFFRTYSLNSKIFYNDVFDFVSPTVGVPFPFRGSLIRFVSIKYPSVLGSISKGVSSAGSLVLHPNPILGACIALASSGFTEYMNSPINGSNILDKVYEVYKVDSVSVLKEYEDWLLEGFLRLRSYTVSPLDTDYSNLYYTMSGSTRVPYTLDSVFEQLRSSIPVGFPDLEATQLASASSGQQTVRLYDWFVPSYYYAAYWKIISDWYINTSLVEPDTFFRQYCTPPTLNTDWCEVLTGVNKLYHRLWANDYFTSAFPSAQAGQAVGIPINGTIVDLRNANAMQKLKERLLYAGSRFRDVMYAITGKRTSAAILEMSEVIASCSTVINVDSVLQQSKSENGSPLADYGGTGLGYRAGSKNFSYTAEEPTVIFIIASIVPQASYFQGLHRKFVRQSVYDYAIPQLANVGEQRVYRGELCLSAALAPLVPSVVGTFGYQRRNADFMWTPNEVHGDFQTSLDFWHNARIFGSIPYLGLDFAQIKPTEDNLNRIWAVKSESVNHFYCRFDFGGQVIRSLPKHVHYDL